MDIEHVFSYHAPTGDQPQKYERIREAAKQLATVIQDNTPQCADQTAALRKVREAVMTANASIALDGRL
jgi:glycyl-tRNA synthetase beta subunit